MAFRIDGICVGCRVCAPKCPTGGIKGEAKQLHVVTEALCIDCGVCASFCPVDDCIFDAHGFAPAKIKPTARPHAVVYADLCSGCGDCIDVCPERALLLSPHAEGGFYSIANMSNPKACTGCKLCELVCGDKRAIRVEWANGVYCVSLADVPEDLVAPRKAGAIVTR